MGALKTAFNHLTSASKTISGMIDAKVETELSETMIAINRDIIAAQGSNICLLYTSPSPRDATLSRMPSSA